MKKNNTLSAGIWSSLDLGARSGMVFLVSILLARLLSPTEFGIYALIAIFVSISQVLIDGGFSVAIVQRAEISREEQTSVFWYNILISLLLAAIIVVAAPLFARSFGYPVLQSLLYVTAAVIPVNALAAVPTAMLQRELRFDSIAKAGLAASTLSALVAVVTALNGAGVWSLAWQAATTATINTCLLWLLSGWRPLSGMHLKAARGLAGFGSLVAVSGLLEVAYMHGSALIIGKLHGARELGFYNRAQTLQFMPTNILTAIVTRVALPVFSTKSQDRDALRRGARMAQGVVMLINLPLMVALITMPDLLITVLYGPKWLFSAPVLAILAIGGVLFPLHAVNLQLLLAQGRSDLFLKVEIAKKGVGITFVAVGSMFGIAGLAIGQTIFAYIAFFINAGVAGRMIGYNPFDQLKDLAGSFALAIAMGILLLVVRPLLHFGSIIDLAILTVLGGMFFYGTAIGLGIGMARDLVAMTPLRRVLSRSRRMADLSES